MSTAELPRREVRVGASRREDPPAQFQVYCSRSWLDWLDALSAESGLKRNELIGLGVQSLAREYGLTAPPRL